MVGALGVAAADGCYNPGAGQDPDDHRLYFPVGIALSQSKRSLFVINSNFDLRFNSGTVQAYDLARIITDVRMCEASRGAIPASVPDNCLSTDASGFATASVRIGAFGADIVSTPRYTFDSTSAKPFDSSKGRLMVPVRGDATLTLIDYEEPAPGQVTLTCSLGAKPNSFGTICDSGWRIGGAPSEPREITLEGEPFSVAVPQWPAGDPGNELVRSRGIAAVVHQTSGDVSLVVGVNSEGAPPQAKLAFTLGGLAGGGTSVTALDIFDKGQPFVPRFLVTNITQSNVFVVSYFGDRGSPDRSGLQIADVVPIQTNSSGYDTRGVIVDPPNADETNPDGTLRPTRVFLTNRSPSSMIVGEWSPDTRRLHFFENVPMPIGPSRLVRASFPALEPDGKTIRHHTRIYAAAFDARAIVSYDPETRRVSNVIRTGKGPYAMTVMVCSPDSPCGDDTSSRLLFVTNFTESTVQVVELDPKKFDRWPGVDKADKIVQAAWDDGIYEQVVYTIGIPNTP